MAGASGYAAAFVGVADVLTGASADAAYDAAYGKYYSAFAGMYNAANQRVAAEANIAAITQEKIHTNTVISMKQDQAEAKARVMAAVSGTEGQSVKDVIYQTELNSSVAQSNVARQTDQQIEQQLTAVYNSTSTMLSLDNVSVDTPSIFQSMVGGVATVMSDKELMTDLGDSLGI